MRAAGCVTLFWLVGSELTGRCVRNLDVSLKLTILHLGGGALVPAVKSKVLLYMYPLRMYPLRRNQDPALLLHCYFLAAPPWFPNSLPSLVSNCSNLFFRTLGKSRRSMPFFLQTWTGDLERLLHLGRPQRVLLVFSFSLELLLPEPTVLERRQA